MKISLNWLKKYINVDKTPKEIADYLTNCGLEVEKIETVESIKGSLKGLVVGQVISTKKHPNADRLTCCEVNIGTEILNIVCGAPNVAKDQKVIVAPVGTTLFPVEGEQFKIKAGKIRGEESNGMICAEDEIGIGISHDGIIVLPNDLEIGKKASEYYDISSDIVFEVAITPNRGDAASHIGVARDLYAVLNQDFENVKFSLNLPDVSDFKIDNNNNNIPVEIVDVDACPRYSAITISDIKVSESPAWLKNYLKMVDIRPINNIVDITNFILMEMGQPLHAFDADKISGKKVIVKKLEDETVFTTLDKIDRKLSNNDLMICNTTSPMCIAGVFGGISSGITNKTTNIFIESACFDQTHIRKTSKFHSLKTDASFRYERGTDPNITVYALKRAAMLIKEIAGGNISSEIIDEYPNIINRKKITFSKKYVDSLTGVDISEKVIINILKLLDFEVEVTNDIFTVGVPTIKTDVTRPADVVEEILRIYGYNKVPYNEKIITSLSYGKKPDSESLRNIISYYLSSNGFYEIMTNSLTSSKYYSDLELFPKEKLVPIINANSTELNVMRQTLMFSALESVSYNLNRQNNNVRFFEFGNVYTKNDISSDNQTTNNYSEFFKLSVIATGTQTPENWYLKTKNIDFVYLKSYVENTIFKIGFPIKSLTSKDINNEIFDYGTQLLQKDNIVAEFGKLSSKILNFFDIKQEVFYAEINWQFLCNNVVYAKQNKVEISKFPIVERDLALIVNKDVTFKQLEDAAYKVIKKMLNKVDLFDVYEGKQIEEGKKSYALRFRFLNTEKTFKDHEIESFMDQLMKTYQEQFSATIRK